LPKTKHLEPANDNPLARLIAAHIAEEGAIPVAEYMRLALAHPEHGYYIAHESIGAKGDFITSPEISQMFGEMIGAWLVDIWLQSGQPDSVKFIELGPGRGTLAADILRTVSAWPELRSALSVHLVETSPRLRQVQFDTLKSWHPTWYNRLEEVPAGFCLIVANEFFDAMPIHQLEKTKKGWMERRVDWHARRREFFFTAVAPGFDLSALMPENFLDAPEGSVFEISPASLTVLDEIGRRISSYGGAGLIVDYGHAASGLGDTLQAVSSHVFSNVLENPGLKDLTAHVDFGTFRAVAEPVVQVHGPATQGDFLLSLGIAQRAAKLKEKATEAQGMDIAAALQRLTAPAEMGGLFKVIGLTPKDKTLHVAGFGESEIDLEASEDRSS
jgi:NADH dehydrogenase [ubiquinone] 1 alpha subcomplex assembly factor 7